MDLLSGKNERRGDAATEINSIIATPFLIPFVAMNGTAFCRAMNFSSETARQEERHRMKFTFYYDARDVNYKLTCYTH